MGHSILGSEDRQAHSAGPTPSFYFANWVIPPKTQRILHVVLCQKDSECRLQRQTHPQAPTGLG